MSMGSWQGLAQRLAAHIVTHDGDGFLAPQVASLFWTKDRSKAGKSTRLNLRLAELANWRNESFGHGAFRADLTEFEGESTKHLEPLHRELGNHRTPGRGSPSGAPTAPCSPAPPASCRTARTLPTDAQTSAGLLARARRRPSSVLAPYVQLRRCTVCDCRDVFLFDWRRTDKEKPGRDKYRFIDYRAGTRLPEPVVRGADPRRRGREARTRARCRRPSATGWSTPTSPRATSTRCWPSARPPPATGCPATSASASRPSCGSVRWGPGGSAPPATPASPPSCPGSTRWHRADLQEARLDGDLADLAVVAFYIRREYQTSPAQLADGLADQLKAALNVAAGARSLPELGLDAADPPRAMVDWLQAMRARPGGCHRLLPASTASKPSSTPAPSGSIADFIPSPESLPEGLFFVLTSLPLGDMPAAAGLKAARPAARGRGARDWPR